MAMSLGPQWQWMGVPKRSGGRKARAGVRCALKAVIFDCDGVILESEHLHRQAYNEAFAHFKVGCEWSPEFYDDLQNRIGGGKPKMRWYFNTFGWPCESQEERATLVDTLQDWKTQRYKAILNSGTVSPRPGVLPLMDHAKAAVSPLLPHHTTPHLLLLLLSYILSCSPAGFEARCLLCCH